MISAIALVPALVLPTVAALFYFVLAAGHWSAALIYGGTKMAMILGRCCVVGVGAGLQA